MPYADDADDGFIQLDGPAGGNAIEGGKDVIRHSGGIAALGILYFYSMRFAPGHIHMVQAYRGAGNQLHPRTCERLFVALGTCADDYGIGLHHGLAVYGPPVHIDNLCIRLQDTLQEGDVGISYYFHLYLTNIAIFCQTLLFFVSLRPHIEYVAHPFIPVGRPAGLL